MQHIALLGLFLLATGSAVSTEVAPPAPLQPVPTERQLAWHALEFYGFIHYTVNTYTDREWGNGDEKPSVFSPTALDTTQWARVAKEAGMKGLILTAKHHDGFCLWPSKFTEHSVKNSPYKNGAGDVVGELAAACREAGLQFGVYLSPWDRNSADYGKPAYIDYFRNQLRELLTGYGPVFEVWFDGANGGTGYYGGARGKREIDRSTYYDWNNTWALVRELQPGASIFSDVGPDIRWVGNESGYAGDPCFATYTPQPSEPGKAPAPGLSKYQESVNGHADGQFWLPAEVDVSIRPGWFYHAKEDDKVRTPENLMQIYYESVGRGASLLLNLPPDPRGLINEHDVAALQGFKKLHDATFGENLAAGARASADRVRGNAEAFAASQVLDADRATYWTTDDADTQGTLTVEFGTERRFDHIVLQEYIELGQRILHLTVEAHDASGWRPLTEATSIGWKRILRFGPTTADAIRIHIDKARACPTLSTVAVFAGPNAK